MSPQPGEIVEGKYRIVRLLGEGGMGSVYEGDNIRIHRKVAIKVLHASVAAKGDVVQRFEREAQAAGRIGSDHIVEVLDLGSLASGERYMVMEFLDGESLGDRIKKRRRLSPYETAPIIHQLLEGLAAAHAAGIIHRDLKPDNVFIMTQRGGHHDFVKVLDFGVSKFNSLDSDMSMTKTGAVMGTPFYMSPEQARGAKIDTRSDLYSVGVAMYQAVTGRVPFNAETFNELVFKIALESPDPAESVTPGLDRGFAQIIAKAMVRDANGRFQTAREFQQALAQWMMTSTPSGIENTPQPVFPTGSGSHPMMHTPDGVSPYQNTHPQLGQSGPEMSRAFGSGPHTPVGSVSGMPSTPAFAQGSLAPQLGASQGGLAVSPPRDRGSGIVIAVAATAMLALAGGGFATYKIFGSHAAAATPPELGSVTVPAMPTAAPSPPPVVETAAPAATDTPAATVAPASTEVPTAPSSTHRTGRIPVVPTTKPSTTPTATPTAKPVTTSTGRTVPGDL